MKSKWHLEFHHDDAWRLCDEATDNWIGLVCDGGGDEVAEFQPIAVVNFAEAKKVAQAVIDAHNAEFEALLDYMA